MKGLKHRIRIMSVVAGLWAASSSGAVETVEALTAFLDTNGIPYDRHQTLTAAVAGALRSIDPGARWLSAEAAQALRAGGEPVYSVGPASPCETNRPALDAVELWPEGLAYLKVHALRSGSGAELLAHLAALTDRTGVILDLRGADGGDLDAAAALASPFHCPGDALFVLHDARARTPATYRATATLPIRAALMVLTDRDTCGAAEALAACCRGVPGVMLIGVPTRGDARVRELLPLPDGGFLYLATRRVAPVDRPSYETVGVAPDIRMSSFDPGAGASGDPSLPSRTPSAKTVRDRELMWRVHHDAVLRRAADILLGLKAIDHVRT
jgi:hypothetical protein